MSQTQSVEKLAKNARTASQDIYAASAEDKNRVLRLVAAQLNAQKKKILLANAKDVKAAVASGVSPAMVERLTLSEKRIAGMAQGLLEVASQADPVWRIESEQTRPIGIRLKKVRVPIGTILFIYESRPNVTTDAAGLCLKSGNAVILRGGKEAFFSNQVLVEIFRQALRKVGLAEDSVQRVATTDRKVLDLLLLQDANIDLVIPRGGESLIRRVMERSRIPVLKHYKGVCHVYVDRYADPAMAMNIALNAKIQRPSVCNAMETLLIDNKLNKKVAVTILKAFQAEGVALIGCKETVKLLPGVRAAKDKDYHTEYLNLTMSVKFVDGVTGAIQHIRTYGSSHTDAIVTQNRKNAELFIAQIDSSSVMWNASTRLSDGGIYGLGAEIGISTDKIHARGPMGADDLTTYKWVVVGQGQIRE